MNKKDYKQTIKIKALARLNHPGKPAKIKIETLFEKVFKKTVLKKQ